MKIAFVAFGELTIQLLAFVEFIYKPSEVIFFDDIAYSNHVVNAFPFCEYANPEYKEYSFFIGLGYKHLDLKNKIIEELVFKNYSLPNIIHHTCYISPSAKLGCAIYVYPMCNIDKNVSIKNGTLINNSVVISHDTEINESCYISPSVTLSGKVMIGKKSFIGVGANIANNVIIGEKVIIGIGSVVTKNIADGKNCIGNPLKILDKKLNLL